MVQHDKGNGKTEEGGIGGGITSLKTTKSKLAVAAVVIVLAVVAFSIFYQ